MASRELNILIKAKNLTGNAIKGVKGELKGLDKTLGKGLSSAWQNTERGIVIGAGAAAAGLGYAVTQAINFEDAFAGVKKTVDATDLSKAGLSFADLSEGIRDMSRSMPIAADEIAAIEEQAGALGVKVSDLQDFTRVAALLGVTTDVSSQDAATALGQLGNVIGLTGADYERFGSTLVDLGNKGASTESQILEMSSRIGASAKLIGLTKDQTLGWSSAVANLGIEAEAGGTAMQKFFLKTLQKVNSPGGLKTLAKTAGMTGKAFKQAYEKDASGALTVFLKGLGKLKQSDQLKVLKDLGLTDQRMTRALLGLAGNTDNLTDSLHTANTAWKENNALQNEADKRFETTKSQLQLLKNNLDDAAITIGQAVLPELVKLAKAATEWIQGHQPQIKQFAKDVAGGIRSAVEWASKLDWGAIGNALKTMGSAGKMLLDAFLGMPSWVQAAVVTGWGLNKLTGGAVGSIIGQLGSGLVKGVLGMNAGVVNIKAGVVNGGGGLGGAPVGGGKGAAGKAAGIGSKLLGGALAVVGGVAVGTEIGGELIRGQVEPAKNFEQSSFDALLKSNDLAKVQAGLKAINDTLNSSDFGSSTAIALSRLPFFNDAMGNLAGTLEDQKKALTQRLDDLNTSQHTTDGILARNASEHNVVIRSSMIANSQKVTAGIQAHAASERGDLRGIESATRVLQPHLSRIAGADVATAAHTLAISHKNYSPRINVTANFSAQLRLSVNAVARSLTSQHISSQAGITGGLIE